MKTILSDKIMVEMSDIIENNLKINNIFYKREGTVFSVRNEDVSKLNGAQIYANVQLLKKGTLTKEMLHKDYENTLNEEIKKHSK